VSGLVRCPWHAEIRLVGGITHQKISNVYVGSESESVNGALPVAMSKPRITYTRRNDAAPEREVDALASVYSFVLQTCQNRNLQIEGSPPTALGDGKKESKHVAAETKSSP